VFGRETATKMSIYNWHKLIRLVAFMRENSPGDEQSLKLKKMNLHWPSIEVHANQPGILPSNRKCHTKQSIKFCGERLKFRRNGCQLLQDKVRYTVRCNSVSRFEEGQLLIAETVSIDDTTFRSSRNVNPYNPKIRGRNNPHELKIRETVKNLNVFYALFKQKSVQVSFHLQNVM
jgi:hypothetical protein